MIVIRYKCS